MAHSKGHVKFVEFWSKLFNLNCKLMFSSIVFDEFKWEFNCILLTMHVHVEQTDLRVSRNICIDILTFSFFLSFFLSYAPGFPLTSENI